MPSWVRIPDAEDDGSDRVKLAVMGIINDMYGITEADFHSAELTLVPAMNARDVGFDRSLIAAYGHDDRVCASIRCAPYWIPRTPPRP